METDPTSEPLYEQLRLFEIGEDIKEYIGRIAVFHYGHLQEYDKYGPLGDERSIARGDDW